MAAMFNNDIHSHQLVMKPIYADFFSIHRVAGKEQEKRFVSWLLRRRKIYLLSFQDLVDLGEGYDVHDPFVDDSEAVSYNYDATIF